MTPPNVIYLLEDYFDGEKCLIWSDSAAPTDNHNPDEAVKYINADEVDSRLLQAAQFHMLEVNELQDRIKHLVKLSELILVAAKSGDMDKIEQSRVDLLGYIERTPS